MDTIDRINAILKERGMSGADLSRKIGLSTAVYSQWNRKKTKPSNKNIAKVADALDVSVYDLIGTGQKENPTSPEADGELSEEEVKRRLRTFSREALLDIISEATDILKEK